MSQGAIKGFVSLGDLRQFAKRLSQPGSAARKPFDDAVKYLNNVRANVKAGLAPSIQEPPPGFLTWTPTSATGAPTYTPDLDSQFSSPGSHIDSRVASPSVARSVVPKTAHPASKGGSIGNSDNVKQLIAAGGIAGMVIGIVTALSHKKG